MCHTKRIYVKNNKMTKIISASIAVENCDRPTFRVSVESFQSFHWCKWKDALHINLLILYSLILGSGARQRIMIMLVNTGHSARGCWHTFPHTHTHFHAHIHQCTQAHGTCMRNPNPPSTPLPCELHALLVCRYTVCAYTQTQQHTQSHTYTHTHREEGQTFHTYIPSCYSCESIRSPEQGLINI